MEQERLDVYMHLNNLVDSREKAKQLIVGKFVHVDDKVISKPSFKVSDSNKITIDDFHNYVGRGALKLEKAVGLFEIKLDNKVCMDIGASTGGFTDYLLQHNAKKVYAIDVGHNQLHRKLRENKKVINFEGVNFRYMDCGLFTDDIDIVVADVSFISLKLIIPKILEIINEKTNVIVLVKPQFEAGKENVGKNGVVKNKSVHRQVLHEINEYCILNNICIKNITYSPIKGGSGNIEYLAHLQKGICECKQNFRSIIDEAFSKL